MIMLFLLLAAIGLLAASLMIPGAEPSMLLWMIQAVAFSGLAFLIGQYDQFSKKRQSYLKIFAYAAIAIVVIGALVTSRGGYHPYLYPYEVAIAAIRSQMTVVVMALFISLFCAQLAMRLKARYWLWVATAVAGVSMVVIIAAWVQKTATLEQFFLDIKTVPVMLEMLGRVAFVPLGAALMFIGAKLKPRLALPDFIDAQQFPEYILLLALALVIAGMCQIVLVIDAMWLLAIITMTSFVLLMLMNIGLMWLEARLNIRLRSYMLITLFLTATVSGTHLGMMELKHLMAFWSFYLSFIINFAFIGTLLLPILWLKNKSLRLAYFTIIAVLNSFFVGVTVAQYFGLLQYTSIFNVFASLAVIATKVSLLVRILGLFAMIATLGISLMVYFALGQNKPLAFANSRLKTTVAQTGFSVAMVLLLVVALTPLEAIFSVSPAWIPNRNIAVRGLYGSYIYDVVAPLLPVRPSAAEEQLVADYLSAHPKQFSEQFGVLKDTSVIFIQLESFKRELLQLRVDGHEITPNLNAFLKQNTLYFDNFYANLGKGNTADSQHSIFSSQYSTLEDAPYNAYYNNSLDLLPALLKEQGYHTRTITTSTSMYNEDKVDAANMKYDAIITPVNGEFGGYGRINNYINDQFIYDQANAFLEQINSPFFMHLITCNQHGPKFEIEGLPEDIATLSFPSQSDEKLTNYLKLAMYEDRLFGEFWQKLKNDSKLDDTVLVVYGDHGPAEPQFANGVLNVNQEPGWLFRDSVPLLISNPRLAAQTIAKTGSTIDVMPTLFDLMGIKDGYFAGQSLLTGQKNGFINLREGYVVSDDFILDAQGKLYRGTINDALYQQLREQKEASQTIVRRNVLGNWE